MLVFHKYLHHKLFILCVKKFRCVFVCGRMQASVTAKTKQMKGRHLTAITSCCWGLSADQQLDQAPWK